MLQIRYWQLKAIKHQFRRLDLIAITIGVSYCLILMFIGNK